MSKPAPCAATPFAALLAAASLAVACQVHGAGWASDLAQRATAITLHLDEVGGRRAVVYELDASALPPRVRAAADAMFPRSRDRRAERRWHDGRVSWTLHRVTADGEELTVIFGDGGRFVERRVAVPAERVPSSVRTALRQRFGEVAGPRYLESRDAEGRVLAYRVRFTDGEARLAAELLGNGVLRSAEREVDGSFGLLLR